MSEKKPIRWNIDLVRGFVKESSECKLLSEYYFNANSDLKFKCKCGEVFYTSFNNFKKTLNNIRECYKCGGRRKPRKKKNKPMKWTIEMMKNFIQNGSKSGCKFIRAERDGVSSRIFLKCKCGEHFELRFNDFKDKNQRACNTCLGKISWNHQMVKEYIESDNSGCKLLSKEFKTVKDKLSLLCKCGQEFKTEFDSFRYMGKRQCNDCGRGMSSGENKIQELLIKLNVKSKREYIFDDCKNERVLPFDFAIYSDNELVLLVEYQGKQHYEPVNFGGISDKKALDKFNLQKVNDKIKKKYCKANNIPLLIIPYWDYGDVEKILNRELSKYGLLHNRSLEQVSNL